MTRPGSAILIGGGIGGLCAAIGLRQAGWQVAVYEKAGMLGDVGAGLVLWANAIRALRALGLADAAVAAGSKIQRGQIRASRGKVLVDYAAGELEQIFGEASIAIHRAALHQVLLSALPAECLHLGAVCTGFEQDPAGVTARFEDGSSARADLLVGADGIRSVIRRQLFPQRSLRCAGYIAWRGVVLTSDEVALGVSGETMGRGARFGSLRLDGERIYWYATQNHAPGLILTPIERKAFLLKILAGWHHPVEHLIQSTAPEDILQNDIYDLEPSRSWGEGRVTLLGDAIHATTPNMGQGACMAVESAVLLKRCLESAAEVPASLRAYERGRMARTAWVTNQSWQIGQMGQVENLLAVGLRDLALALLPDSLFKNQTGKAIGYDVTQVDIEKG